MNIGLKPITKDNYKECVGLEVEKDQKSFVASNSWSLLEANYEEGEFFPLAIYNEDIMVGFLMFSYFMADEDYPVDSWWFQRLMIDKNHQNKGYGKLALAKSIELMKNKLGPIELRISAVPENTIAIRMYEEYEFKKTGELACDEIVLLKLI